GHALPASLPPSIQTRAIEEVRQAVRAVGLCRSAFHVELWLAPPGDLVLGEVHARPGGDWIHLLVEACCGVDLFDAALADLLGHADDLDGDRPSGAAAVV